MAQKQTQKRAGVKNISLEMEKEGGAFSAFFHLFSGESSPQEVGQVRALLSNERAKIIHSIKSSNPKSIYILAKQLGRDFKSVRKDIALLEHLGIIRLEKQGKNRASLKPLLNLDILQININF